MPVAATLLIALLTGEAAVVPQPAEPPITFQCRARLQPKARRCAQLCRATLADENAAFECVTGCTTRTLDALAVCRRAPDAPAAALAVR
jgi:hypothetical protein